jgi:hypothetical protein
MLTLVALLENPINEYAVGMVAILAGLAVVISISIAIAYTKVRHKEAERDMYARRLAYEQRMKELEVEALRLRAQGVNEPSVASR